jgi:DNA-binding MurR/RpiR family transcriptional regulator
VIDDLHMLLRQHYDTLPLKQRQVAEVILSSPMASSYSTVQDLAMAAGVTKATVVRLCQSLGFPGYAELRTRLRGPRSLEQLWPLDLLKSAGSVTADGVALSSIQQDAGNLQHLFTQEFQDSLAAAVSVMARARRILVISTGSHAATGLVLTHNLTFIGRPAELENRGGSYLGQALSVLTPDDLVISLVFWHVQPEIIGALQWCKEHGVPTLAITDSPVSRTAVVADQSLAVPTESSSFFRSQTAAMAAANALLSELAAVDKEHTVAAIARAQSVWDQLGIYYGTKS